ncbi:MAG: PEGA domain-containing protein [Verrucomicrobia bacterium]|nr:PEGA domain-containing protein [Verrucomicrobiota bacterium]
MTTVVLLCGGLFVFKLVKDNTTLSFSFVLDGKPLPVGTKPAMQVDGQPFISGLTITPGPHKLTVDLQIAEPFERRVWVFFGNKNLGVLSLESSRGSLVVSVNPSPAGVILRRGTETVGKGDAPLTVDKLLFGDYELEIKRGEYKETRPVKIEGRQRTAAKIDLNLGSVHLSADPPDAEFQLSGNGRQWDGKLPTLINDVPVGDYRFTARRKAWEVDTTLSVTRGETQTNKIEFSYGSIEVSSDPVGLMISTNGVETGKTPLMLRDLKPGQYKLTATDGENDLLADISVEPKKASKHAFVFRYGSVRLTSTPTNATVIRKGKEVGKTPLTLEHIPTGDISVELRLAGYAPTNFPLQVQPGATIDLAAKLINERYLQTMKEAREKFEERKFDDSQRFVAVALGIEPGDADATKLQGEISEAKRKAEDALRKKQADAKTEALASLTWLDFQKVISDCTDTKQVQYPVEFNDGYYDNKGKLQITGHHTEMRTRTESAFNPIAFSDKYKNKTFGFNCPDKWSVSKVEKEGGIILKAGRGIFGSDEIRATAPTSNRDALKSLQKGQKVRIKVVVKKYEEGVLVRTLYVEDAEILDK